MDEEQETSYQSENPPRYHARDVAQFRCAQSGALLLLGPDKFLLPSLLVTVAALTLLRPVLEPKYAEGGAGA